MKTFFKAVGDFFISMAQARAASALARQGRVEEAKKVYE